jgi:hypothetical protein
LTSSRPSDCSNISERLDGWGQRGAYIFGRLHLQIGCPGKEFFKDCKDTISLKHALQATQEAQVQLDFSPYSLIQLTL